MNVTLIGPNLSHKVNYKKGLTPDHEFTREYYVGVEVEQLLGNCLGYRLPLQDPIMSSVVKDRIRYFHREADKGKIETVTDPCINYQNVLKEAVRNRLYLRKLLQQISSSKRNPELTVLPGSKLALENQQAIITDNFDPEDSFLRERIATFNERTPNFVTGSIHFNIGNLGTQNEIIRLSNLMRLEAPFTLALSASSPFYLGELTGLESHRWANLPRKPKNVPFFESHKQYITWVENAMRSGEVSDYTNTPSIRRFWSAVRPHGDDRPYNLNRIEIRISDLITNWDHFMAVLAWNVMRVEFYKQNLDLKVPNSELLIRKCDENEDNTAKHGLSAVYYDWLRDCETTIKEAIEYRLKEMSQIIDKLRFSKEVDTLHQILEKGNEAQQKTKLFQSGGALGDIVQDWIKESEMEDFRMARELNL
jgi:predicted glutamate--cysteine ligase